MFRKMMKFKLIKKLNLIKKFSKIIIIIMKKIQKHRLLNKLLNKTKMKTLKRRRLSDNSYKKNI